MTGALAHYGSTKSRDKYRPMVPVFELMDNYKQDPEIIFEESMSLLAKKQQSINQ